MATSGGATCVLLAVVSCAITQAAKDPILTTYSKGSGSLTINSSNYADMSAHKAPQGYRMDRSIFHYKLEHSSAGGVRLQFIDFDLNYDSVIKIYDGPSTMHPDSVWHHNDTHPVFASSQSSLLVVFKPGNLTDNKKTLHLGFQMRVTFTSERRTSWPARDIPQTGYCNDISKPSWNSLWSARIEDKVGSGVTDCSYLVTGAYRSLIVAQPKGANLRSSAAEAVYDYPTASLGRRLVPTRLRHLNTTYNIYNLRNASFGFNIRIRQRLARHSSVIFGYTDRILSSDILIKQLENTHPSDRGCPFKKCNKGRCVDYWEPCYRDGSAGSCDHLTEKRWSYVSCGEQCYSLALDRCDGFQDCMDGTDEECSGPIPSAVYGLIIFAVGLVPALAIIARYFSIHFRDQRGLH